MMMMKRYRTRSVTLEERKASLLSSLPTDIMVNILSRLPVKTIVRCRCVCKTWRNLLLDPYFVKQHPVPVNLLLFFTDKYDSVPTPRYFYLCGINAGRTAKDGNNEVVTFKTEFKLRYMVGVVGSCNGLLCLSSRAINYKEPVICNPITGDYIIVPLPELKGRVTEEAYMFGYSSLSNHYKVIRIKKYNPYEAGVDQTSRGEIYTLGTDTWRSIGDVPFPKYKPVIGVPLNGALHWIVESKYDIYSLDIESEQVHNIPLPSQLTINYVWHLGVLGSCLCVSGDDSSGGQLDIWVMKDYGVKESWSKDYVIEKSSNVTLTPITMQEDGRILMLRNYSALVLYNLRTENFQRIKIDGRIQLNFDFQAVLHLPIFLSLKDILQWRRF